MNVKVKERKCGKVEERGKKQMTGVSFSETSCGEIWLFRTSGYLGLSEKS